MASVSPDGFTARFTITGTGLELTARQRDLLELAEELGVRFGRRAARYDIEASFPFENYDEMREAGLLKLCVPASHGGLGADLFTYALVSATLGKHCAATALTLASDFRARTDEPGTGLELEALGSAAALLFALAQHATEILVRRTLSSIARDEKRHAALGADILRWCAKRILGAEPALQSTVG